MRKPGVDRARQLRRTLSAPEAMLWQRLRGQQCGFKVRRQHPIGPYVVDFFVSAARLAIEVDGDGCHLANGRGDADAVRERFLTENGYAVLRLPASLVMTRMDDALSMIAARAENPLHHSAAPSGPPPRDGEDAR